MHSDLLRGLSRREFLRLTGTTASTLALASLLDSTLAAQLFAETDQLDDLTGTALASLKKLGAGYGDIRVARYRTRTMRSRNDRLNVFNDGESYGFGVRVLHDGAWGFASSNVTTPDEVRRVTKLAFDIAKASALVRVTPVVLAPEPKHVDRYKSPMEVDPFSIPVEKQVAMLLESNAIMKKNPGVKVASSFLNFARIQKRFASTEGTDVTTELVRSQGNINATAVTKDDSQSRSHEATLMHAGWEHIEKADFLGNAERVAAEAVEKVHAPEGPSGNLDLILDPRHLCLVLHESCGHPSELDRALGQEANFAGTSFLTPDQIGKLQYGSKVINIVADNTRPESIASIGYDDEGVAGQKWDIIREGMLVGFSTNRECAPVIGLGRSGGSCRADSWQTIPIIRIANVGLEPGTADLADMIADTKDGIYIEGTGSWSIDQRRYNFQFGGNAFWRIENGKKTGMLKNVLYQGITPEFWGACDAVANEKYWYPWGVGNCGKGQPEQIGAMTHGASHARFRGIKVFGAKQA